VISKGRRLHRAIIWHDRGEFAKQLASITGIWVDPSKMAEDITELVKLILAEQPFGSTSAQLMTMRKAILTQHNHIATLNLYTIYTGSHEYIDSKILHTLHLAFH
jgi:hypothetical protein